MFRKTRVAVLSGGPSSEYDVSLKTGRTVLDSLPEEYIGHDIFIDKAGNWHFEGIRREPKDILKKVDVVFNALHGEFGEDGKLQKLLDSFGVPYTGSGALGSAIGMNKVLTKRLCKTHGIKTAHHTVLKQHELTHAKVVELFKTFPMPAIVKPVASGSSVGVSVARTLPELSRALVHAFEYGPEAIIEEYIVGKEATCGVIEHFRGHPLYALMPVEIILPRKDGAVFDYTAKYTGGAKELCPGSFTPAEKKQIQDAAIAVHKVLGLKHYSRSDFIVHPKRGVYLLEVNTLPGMTRESLFPLALSAVGSSISEFVGHTLKLALKR
ncbi:MAG: D-alanine--D-alanine ligase [Patescibacteria group bacterium]